MSETPPNARERGEGLVHRHEHSIPVVEAVLLSIVTIVAAWSGYSAAKWHTRSSLELAQASATRTKANRSFQEALIFRAQDAADFNAWFSAHLDGDRAGERVAEKRFRPEYDAAFRAWLATRPFTNPGGRKGRSTCRSTGRQVRPRRSVSTPGQTRITPRRSRRLPPETSTSV